METLPIPAKISKSQFTWSAQLQRGYESRTATVQDDTMPKFVPRQRKHKVIARQQQSGSRGGVEGHVEGNVDEILPAEKREREERKKELKGEMVKDSQGK